MAGCGDRRCPNWPEPCRTHSNANKTILHVVQEDPVADRSTELELRVGEDEDDAVLEISDSDGNSNRLEVDDAFADESCTAEGETCRVTAPVDEDGNLQLGVNDRTYQCIRFPCDDGLNVTLQCDVEDYDLKGNDFMGPCAAF